jgi:hypothetical protein
MTAAGEDPDCGYARRDGVASFGDVISRAFVSGEMDSSDLIAEAPASSTGRIVQAIDPMPALGRRTVWRGDATRRGRTFCNFV